MKQPKFSELHVHGFLYLSICNNICSLLSYFRILNLSITVYEPTTIKMLLTLKVGINGSKKANLFWNVKTSSTNEIHVEKWRIFAALLLHWGPCTNYSGHTWRLAMPEVQMVPELSPGQPGRPLSLVWRLWRSLPRTLPSTSDGLHSEKWLEMQGEFLIQCLLWQQLIQDFNLFESFHGRF